MQLKIIRLPVRKMTAHDGFDFTDDMINGRLMDGDTGHYQEALIMLSRIAGHVDIEKVHV